MNDSRNNLRSTQNRSKDEYSQNMDFYENEDLPKDSSSVHISVSDTNEPKSRQSQFKNDTKQ